MYVWGRRVILVWGGFGIIVLISILASSVPGIGPQEYHTCYLLRRCRSSRI